MEMKIYTININKQSPGTMAIGDVSDLKKVITKRKNQNFKNCKIVTI